MRHWTGNLCTFLFGVLAQIAIASNSYAVNHDVTITCNPPPLAPQVDNTAVHLEVGDTVNWKCADGCEDGCTVLIKAPGIENPLEIDEDDDSGMLSVPIPPAVSVKYSIVDEDTGATLKDLKFFAHLWGWEETIVLDNTAGSWKDSDGIHPEVPGCHVKWTAPPPGCGMAAAPADLGEYCVDDDDDDVPLAVGEFLIETNPSKGECHDHPGGIGHPDKYDCDDYCEGKYGVGGECREVLNVCQGNTQPSARCHCDLGNHNHYLCRQVKDLKVPVKFVSVTGISVVDQTSTDTCAAKKPFLLCNPVNKNGEGIQNPNLHYCCYKVKCTQKPAVSYAVKDQFWIGTIATKKPKFLCNPCNKTIAP